MKTVEQHYQHYLDLAGIKDESQMPPDQRREMRRVFFGAWGQCLMYLRDEISDLEESSGADEMISMLRQVEDFWEKEVADQNENLNQKTK